MLKTGPIMTEARHEYYCLIFNIKIVKAKDFKFCFIKEKIYM